MNNTGEQNTPWSVWAIIMVVVALIGAYATMHAPNPPTPTPVVRPNPDPAPQSIDFTIMDRLGPNQISEQVVIVIDGRNVGTLTVDTYHPTAALKVTVPGSGRYSYSASAEAVFNVQGQQMQFFGTGQGMISASSRKSFDLQGSFSGNTWDVSLVEI
jgi:hypothetical protein